VVDAPEYRDKGEGVKGFLDIRKRTSVLGAFYTIRGFYHGKRDGEAETFLRRI
jgi:hypothetical protein